MPALSSHPDDLPPVVVQMSARGGFGAGTAPLHLAEAGTCRHQMRAIDGAGLVVVGQVAERAAVGAVLDCREG